MPNIFQDPSKRIPRQDPQIVRVAFDQNEIGGRKEFLPAQSKSGDMAVSHVPNKGGAR